MNFSGISRQTLIGKLLRTPLKLIPAKANEEYVHYGCGPTAPVDWINFDASPTARLQKFPFLSYVFINKYFTKLGFPIFPKNIIFGDIVRGLPIEPNSCKAIYCSHVLEHLSLTDFRIALRNSYNYLQADGIFRLVLPDLEKLTNDYLQSNDPSASIIFMEQTYLGKKIRPRGLLPFFRQWLGNSSHLWMWDYKSLSLELEQVGFRNIRRANFGDSAEPRFASVECLERWQDCLGIECSKSHGW